MRYALGVDVGTSFTAAAIWRADGQQQNKAEMVTLSNRMPSVSSVLFLGEDGSVVVGEAAERRALTDPDRVVREFKRRIGDETPLLVGGRAYAAHDLAAMMVRWVVDRVTEREGGPPDRIAITHPAGWGSYKKDLLSRALSAVGLHDLTFLAEPEAAAVSYAAQERVEAGATIAVYDLGGGTFDAAVVRKTGADSFALLGSAEGLEQLGGADFDEAVFTHVQAQLDAAQWDALDVEDPNVLSGLARLRRECIEAKEALSSDTVVSIPVLLPGISSHVRLVRGEFEEMIRSALEDTIDSLARAINSADLGSADLGAVLLVGGSSGVPLVTQLVSAALGCPVVVDADPKATIALGAALSMAPQAQPAAATTEATAPPAAEPESPVGSDDLPDQVPHHAPHRPPAIPAQRGSVENDALLRQGTITGRLRTIVGAGALASVLMIALAVSAAEGGLVGGTSDTPLVSVDLPRDAVEVPGSDGPAEASTAGLPNAPHSPNKVTVARATASRPGAANPSAPVSSQGGSSTSPTSPPMSTNPDPDPQPDPQPQPDPKPDPDPQPDPTPDPDPQPDPTPDPNPQPDPGSGSTMA